LLSYRARAATQVSISWNRGLAQAETPACYYGDKTHLLQRHDSFGFY
jgi:hypothetical protein